MGKFRALLYREWRLNRKGLLCQGGMSLLYAGMLWATCLSSMQNTGMSPEEQHAWMETMVQICGMAFAMLEGLLGLYVDYAYKADLETGWLRYSYALPITPRDRIFARMTRTGLCTALGMGFGLVNIVGLCAVTEVPFSAGYLVMQAAVLNIVLLSVIVNECFTLAARNTDQLKKLTQRGGMVFFALSAAVVLCIYLFGRDRFEGLFGDDWGGIDLMRIFAPRHLLWLLPLLLVLIACHYGVMYWRLCSAEGTHTWKRREKACKAEGGGIDNQSLFTGFFYKELRQNRQGILVVLLLPVFILVLIAVMIALTRWSNPEEMSGSLVAVFTSKGVRGAAAAVGAFIASSMLTGVFQGDDKKLWACFVTSTPAGVKGAMYYKYVLLFFMNVLYLAVWYVMDYALMTLRFFSLGEEIGGLLNLHVTLFFLLLFLSALDIPFIVRFGAKKGSIIKISMVIGISLLLVLVYALLPEEVQEKLINFVMNIYNGNMGNGLTLFLSVCPWIALSAYGISYKVSCKLFLKGGARND